MEKITEMYYNDHKEDNFATGLYIKTESGEIYMHLSTDSIIPFKRIHEKELFLTKPLRSKNNMEKLYKARAKTVR